MRKAGVWLIVVGGLCMALGSTLGITMAPPERHMGDVSRILYVHFPIAINSLLIYTMAFGFAVAGLWSGKARWDALVTGALETGVVFNILLLLSGMIFARPTWGIWWDWDVRLTTSLVSLLLFGAILAMRSFVEDPHRRMTWTAVSTVVAYVDVPLIYFCVRWWRSLHQVQSSPETVSSTMLIPLRLNLGAALLIGVGLVLLRATLEERRVQAEEVPLPEPVGRPLTA